MSRSRHVIAVICRFDWDFYRALLQGVCDFGRETGHRVFPGDLTKQSRFWGDETTAIIYDGVNDRVRRWVRAKQLPAVDVSGYSRYRPAIKVRPDDEAITELVVDHFVGKGLRHLGYVGISGVGYSEVRRDLFKRRVEASGTDYHEFIGERPDQARPFNDPRDPPAVRWLKRAPKPIGLFVCNDDRAVRLLEQCRRAGLRVPEDVAVVGVDNDMIHVIAANPPLSTVDVGARRIGFEAARILIELAANPAAAADRIVSVKPVGLIARQSSDILAISDTVVAAAIRYIREHVSEGLRVKHLAAVTDLSRRSLEQRFRAAIGRSPSEEIRHVQLGLARQLLAGTSIDMAAIAQQTGFSSARQFGATFQAHLGTTPTAYRKQFAVSA